MTRISMLNFIGDGVFGPIGAPVSRKELRSILGSPDEFGCLPDEETVSWRGEGTGELERTGPLRKPNPDHALIWLYGSFEFHFHDREGGRLFLIFADNFKMLCAGQRLTLDRWKLRGGASRLAIEAELQKLRIAFEVSKVKGTASEMRLATAAGTKLLFNEDPHCDEPQGLWAISRRLM